MAGVGYGCAYTPPIQALLEWFPDKRGLASGIVISGFGSGALFFAPIMNYFTRTFSTLPTYLGNQLETITEGGKLFAKVGDSLQEVVFATTKDLAKLPFSGLVSMLNSQFWGFVLLDFKFRVIIQLNNLFP